MPDFPAGAGEQRELLARLRAVVEAKDAEVAMLRAELTAERDLRRRMELRIAELERRLGQDSTDTETGSWWARGSEPWPVWWRGLDDSAGLSGERAGVPGSAAAPGWRKRLVVRRGVVMRPPGG